MDMDILKKVIDQILLYFFKVFEHFGFADAEDVKKFEDEYVNAPAEAE